MSEGRSQKVLSCASCRQRKIKCDKVQPVCTQCSRASIECVFPSRKPTRRLPRPRQSELLERISRLETIVGQADPDKLQELDRETGISSSGITPSAPRPKKSQDKSGTTTASHQDQSSAASNSSKSPSQTQNNASRYLSDEFWGNLCEEVEGIKHALDQTSDDDDDEEQDEDSPESIDPSIQSSGEPSGEPSGFVLGNPNFNEGQKLSHPHTDTILRLWAIYVRNVDPLIKILHRPSLNQDIQNFVTSPSEHHLLPSQNALLFNIYFAALSTLSPEAAEEQLGESHDVLVKRYRVNAEKALAAAKYMETTSLATLQAITIYTTVLRATSFGRSSWILTSVVIRLAQAMNLHRDGDGHRHPPFEAEMRRRLWYFICVLDVRGAEDRGSDTILTPTSYNTIRPTNIDDDAFGPNSTEPLKPQPTPADNIICMCTARCSTFGYIIHPQSRSSTAGADTTETPLHTEDELIMHVRALENDFIHTADPSNMSSRYASEVARMVILKLWLIVQYPYSSQPSVAPLRVSHETMLRTAVSVMELSDRMIEGPWKDRFAWWTKCYVQWHPLAVALAELCSQPEGDLADRAWRVVERVFPLLRDTVADTARGPLWRPIRKLYKKAKEARQASKMKGLSINDKPQPASQPQKQLPAAMQPEAISDAVMQQSPAADDGDNILPSSQSIIPGAGVFLGDPGSATSAYPLSSAYPDPLDAMNMDPSYLFQYPPEFGNVNFDQPLDSTMSFDMAPWNEFLNDTQMDLSPESGGGDSI